MPNANINNHYLHAHSRAAGCFRTDWPACTRAVPAPAAPAGQAPGREQSGHHVNIHPDRIDERGPATRHDRHGCGAAPAPDLAAVRWDDLVERFGERPNGASFTRDRLLGDWSGLYAFFHRLMMEEARIAQAFLARVLNAFPHLVVFEERTIPVTKAALQNVRNNPDMSQLVPLRTDPAQDREGSYRADLVVVDTEMHIATVIDCKRRAINPRAPNQGISLPLRMKAAMQALPYVLNEEDRLWVESTDAVIIDQRGEGARGDIVHPLSAVDRLFNAPGAHACFAGLSEALGARVDALALDHLPDHWRAMIARPECAETAATVMTGTAATWPADEECAARGFSRPAPMAHEGEMGAEGSAFRVGRPLGPEIADPIGRAGR